MQGLRLDAAARHPLRRPDGAAHPNVVNLARVIDHPNIEVGPHAYANDFEPVTDWAARLAPYLHPGAPERLRIGPFVQIAHGVRFVTASANHPMRGLSTYPFRIFGPAAAADWEALCGPFADTEVGPDAWLGHGALVLPGARIGAGAILAAGAVLSGEAPPYAILAGAPARPVRLRLAPAAVEAMLALRWWDRPVDWIERRAELIEAADLPALVAAVRADGVAEGPGDTLHAIDLDALAGVEAVPPRAARAQTERTRP
ncbi:MAG: CatB-related O-acetyltransferase [Albimonas sp.]|uniref:CatB-related O-acetyltransferase n=1 Tax=Albimonas sp. TaxID=1872425 RepID=UPI0040575ECB|tara:strand:- start:147 stop:920 length:774 start_codon:yes stop_codon:yes gene_type:complete